MVVLITFKIIYPQNLDTLSYSKSSTSLTKLENIAANIAEQLVNNMPKTSNTPFKLVVPSITYYNYQYSSPFLQYFLDEVSNNLAKSNRFQIIKGEKLAELIRKNSLILDEEYIPDTPAGIIHCTDSDGVLIGKCFESEDSLSIHFQIKDNKSTDALSSTSIILKKREIPESIALLPDNHEKIIRNIDFMISTQSNDSDLKVKLWLDRLDGGVYKTGENIKVYVWSNSDCYIKLVYHDVAGNNLLIFPNEYSQINNIKGNRVYEIPGIKDRFDFTVVPPCGVEVMKLFASTLPLKKEQGNVLDNGITRLSLPLDKLITNFRGMNKTKNDLNVNQAAARCVIATIKVRQQEIEE